MAIPIWLSMEMERLDVKINGTTRLSAIAAAQIPPASSKTSPLPSRDF